MISSLGGCTTKTSMFRQVSKNGKIRELTRKYVCQSASSIRSQVRYSTSVTPNEDKNGFSSVYDGFLERLKSNKDQGPLEKEPKTYLRAFNDINADSLDQFKSQATDTAWTSDYDPVSRARFAKDIYHLQSLLDALIASGNFDRADSILRAIYPLSNSIDHFIFSLNKYLEAWGEHENISFLEMKQYVRQLESRYGENFTNDRTYAIFLAKSLKSQQHEDYEKLLHSIKKDVYLTRKTLNHIDVLGADALTTIFQDNILSEVHVPRDLIQMFKQTRQSLESNKDNANFSADLFNELPDYFTDEGGEVPILEKDAETLKSVDAFGLRVIRHTLLGLQSNEQSQELDNFIKNFYAEADTNVIKPSNTRTDFFEINKSIKDEQIRSRFNEALDSFNEIRERALEAKGLDAARGRWQHEFEELQKRGGSVPLDKSLNSQLYVWYKELLPLVQEEYQKCQNIINENSFEGLEKRKSALNTTEDRSFYAPFFVLVPPEKMTVITILELLKLNSTGGIIDGMRIGRAVVSVGKAIELEYRSQSLVQQEGKSFSKKKRNANEWKKLIRQRDYLSRDPGASREWDAPIHVKVGGVLTSLLVHIAKIPVTGTDPTTGKTVKALQPAFHHTYQFIMGQKLGVLKLHKSLIRQLGSRSVENSVQPQLLPMLVSPRPWCGHNNGGYLYSQTGLIRTKDSSETLAYLKASSNRISGVYDGLNVLGETPWTINRKVFEVITHYWNTGKQFLDIPPVSEEIKYPEPVAFNAEPEAKKEYQKKLKQAVLEASAMNSQRCDTNYKLEIARGFLGEKLFFPHNIDFRGRAYPLSPHLNHLGNDLTRSLFLFWNGKEVGEKGLDWLKIHLSNVYGYDKVPLKDRIEFANKNMENIKAVAKDPYQNQWWIKGDKPWQILGICYELAEAYSLEDPTKFVSHFPVHQDGTCNGLQHYAALGGDVEGARQVNLKPADRPQDVYTYVAGLVIKRVKADAEAGNEMAIFFEDKITRKVVKQTVMTNVYGVTFVGALAQIKKQVIHHFGKDEDEKAKKFTKYLTSLVFDSVRELFEGAHLIQDWLAEAAKRISKSVRLDTFSNQDNEANKPNHSSSVIWTTPLGLPCVQPYRVLKTQLIRTNLQDISIHDPFSGSQVDARRQQTAFPPNFVHSLDATHMLMTSKACGDDNLNFASVHDSYWTHASDVDTMNYHIRNQFVKLHQDNLVTKLKDEFEHRYKGFLQVAYIKNDSDLAKEIRSVRRSIVKNLGRGLTFSDEMYLENKRRQLLSSSDPKEVEMGKEMVTTISVCEGKNIEDLICKSSNKSIQVLVPLNFPEIPPKGEFDVAEVKNSQYFFS